MVRLSYSYYRYPTNPISRPMASAIAINTQNGKTAYFVGILDTGADSVTLTKEVAEDLEIDLHLLEDREVGGVHGVDFSKRCDFVRVGLIDPMTSKKHFPNGRYPNPLYFSSQSYFCLLGQKSFLSRVISTFDGISEIASLEF